MTEVKNLISTVIGFALALGIAGTLYDRTRSATDATKNALQKDQLSFRKWNDRLHDPIKKKQ